MTTITEPGIYSLPPDVYHGDPVPDGSLSPTRARVLLTEGGPLRYRWQQAHPQHRAAFDIGHALHAMVLGAGGPVVAIDAQDWRTKAAREARTAAHEQGAVPLLRSDYERVAELASHVTTHSLASELLGVGEPEQAMFWRHPSGLWLRGQADWLRPDGIVDLKTTSRIGPRAWGRHAYDLGYHMQAAWYRHLARQLGLGDLPFWHVVVELEGPGLVYVARFDDDLLAIGEADMQQAIDIYNHARQANRWDGYPADQAITITPPAWALKQRQAGEAAALADAIDNLLEENS